MPQRPLSVVRGEDPDRVEAAQQLEEAAVRAVGEAGRAEAVEELVAAEAPRVGRVELGAEAAAQTGRVAR